MCFAIVTNNHHLLTKCLHYKVLDCKALPSLVRIVQADSLMLFKEKPICRGRKNAWLDQYLLDIAADHRLFPAFGKYMKRMF